MPLNWKQTVSELLESEPLRAAHALLMTLVAIAWMLASVPTASAADVHAVRLWRAPDHTRVVLDLSDAASSALCHSITLSDSWSICHRAG